MYLYYTCIYIKYIYLKVEYSVTLKLPSMYSVQCNYWIPSFGGNILLDNVWYILGSHLPAPQCLTFSHWLTGILRLCLVLSRPVHHLRTILQLCLQVLDFAYNIITLLSFFSVVSISDLKVKQFFCSDSVPQFLISLYFISTPSLLCKHS